LTDYRKYTTKAIEPLAISTKISSFFATENYCKWNRNILSHATRAATRGGYIWQLASTVKGKRSLKHLGPKTWDSIDPYLNDISPPAFKRQLKDKLVNEYSD